MTIKATTENVTSLVATKLTGAFPVLDASALTGIDSGPQSGASDPTVSTNPSGVGIVYENTTSGQMFICTSATAGANIWINVGAGDGDIRISFQGSISGFLAGGYAAPNSTARIDKFNFASNVTATDHGDLTAARNEVAGQTDFVNNKGYASGGVLNDGTTRSDIIDKFNFASSGNATDHGNLTVARKLHMSGSSSQTHGYSSAGDPTGPPKSDTIDKFAFGSNANATDHGNLTLLKERPACASSKTHGFVCGGQEPARTNRIEKFDFASNTTATDFGDLTGTKSEASCASSITHGFVGGGYTGSAKTNVIGKFAFASSNNAVDHGDLSVAKYGGASCSGLQYGFFCGGNLEPGQTNVIGKYPYATNSGSVDHGDLVANNSSQASSQY
jgi:hypothetical protein